jgi:hypothetical protein
MSKSTPEAMDTYCDNVITAFKNYSDEQLQKIIDRPFIPSPYNSGFDFEKYCALIILEFNKGVENAAS